jgi:hypothetical protein
MYLHEPPAQLLPRRCRLHRRRRGHELIDFDGGDPVDDMIVLPAEGSHRAIFINKDALDYVMVPTHQYIEGRTESHAEELDALEATKKDTRKSTKPRTTTGDR